MNEKVRGERRQEGRRTGKWSGKVKAKQGLKGKSEKDDHSGKKKYDLFVMVLILAP